MHATARRCSAAIILSLVAAVLTTGPAGAAYPGANGPIVFSRGGDIWLVDADGSGPRNLTNTPNIVERDAVVSPDGSRVAYMRDEIYHEIWTMGIDGSTPASVTTDHAVLGDADYPTWSPDGARIAFQGFMRTEGNTVLWVVGADGTGLRQVTTGYTLAHPSWSTGGQIAVVAAQQLHVIDPSSGASSLLYDPGASWEVRHPDWTPEGDAVVYECQFGFGSPGVCIVGAGGAGHQVLTGDDVYANGPAVAPDGTAVTFAGQAGNQYDIQRIPIGGGAPTTVVSGLESDQHPDWGPAASAAPQPDPDPDPDPVEPIPPAGAFDGDPATTEVIERAEPVGAAIEIARARFADTGFAQSGGAAWVVLSRDDDFPDSLAGSALTGAGPMLFTDSTVLTPSTHEEIRRVLAPPGRVYLLGGTGAISQGIEDQLRAEGYAVQRLAGPSRVETALAVADEIRTLFADTDTVLLARDRGPADNPTAGWADSVSGGGIAAYGAVPILVTPTATVHPAVAAWLQRDGTQRTILLGGTAALSTDVESRVPGATRVAGDDRTSTATAIAQQLWPDEEGRRYVVVNGFDPEGWAFGLAAAGIAADAEAPVILVGGQVSPATAAVVSTCGAPAVDLLLVGDASVIAPGISAELDRLDGDGCGDTGGSGGSGGAPPPAGGSAGTAGTWTAEPRSGVVELEFTYDGNAITGVEGRLLWYCDGNYVSEYVTFYPETQTIPVQGGAWHYDHEFDDGEGNTYHEHFSGTFTSPTTASGVVEYEFAGNGYYCDSYEIEWTAALNS